LKAVDSGLPRWKDLSPQYRAKRPIGMSRSLPFAENCGTSPSLAAVPTKQRAMQP
jgi:hypothetical protein